MRIYMQATGAAYSDSVQSLQCVDTAVLAMCGALCACSLPCRQMASMVPACIIWLADTVHLIPAARATQPVTVAVALSWLQSCTHMPRPNLALG